MLTSCCYKTEMAVKKILVIHSDGYIRDILDICLSHIGWKIVTARSPLEGLNHANEYQPDAIIFDLSTVGMNFFAFVKRLRGNPHTEQIPMLLIGYEVQWLKNLPLQELKIASLLDYPRDISQLKAQITSALNW